MAGKGDRAKNATKNRTWRDVAGLLSMGGDSQVGLKKSQSGSRVAAT
jgi:hypothetical protein